FYIGVDIGQRQDYSAIAIIEKYYPAADPLRAYTIHQVVPRYRLHSVRKLPLGTPFEKVIEEVVSSGAHPDRAPRREIVIDATGVGAPVVEDLKRKTGGVIPVLITGGERATSGGGFHRVPKKDLITTL